MAIKITTTKRANGLLLQTGPTVDYTINILQYVRDRGRKSEGEDLGGIMSLLKFISISVWQEILNNSSGHVDQVITL